MQTHEATLPASSTIPAIGIPAEAAGLKVGPWRLTSLEPCPVNGAVGCPDRIIGYLLLVREDDGYVVETTIDGPERLLAREIGVMLELADHIRLPRALWPDRLIATVLECGHISEVVPLMTEALEGEPS